MLELCPIDLKQANLFVSKIHRHHYPVPGCKFVIGVTDGKSLRGVGIVGRPVSRMLDNGYTLEVNRCCTDGVKNGCSIIYGAARRIAQSLGYNRIITYTLPEEGGASLKASGWMLVGEAGGGKWSSTYGNGKERKNRHPLGKKLLWESLLRITPLEFDWKNSVKAEDNKEGLNL